MPSHDITVNDATFSIRQNLHDFFTSKARSSVYADQWMWIDQLCIDQAQDSDATVERNFQVQRMSDIYSQASEVGIWLGAADADSDVAMEVVKTYREYENAEYDVANSPDAENRATIGVFHKSQKSEDMWVTIAIRKVESVHRLFSRSYWSRLWIIQEIFLAQRVSLMCGSVVLTDEQIPESWWFWERFDDKPATEAITFRQSSRYRQITLGRWDATAVGEDDGDEEQRESTLLFPWISILFQYSKADCYDPRDKIYGLNGMVVPDQRVRVDYSVSTAQIFTDMLNLFGRSGAYAGSKISEQMIEDLYGLFQQMGLAPVEKEYNELGSTAKEMWHAAILRKDETGEDVLRNDVSYDETNALSKFMLSLTVTTIVFDGYEITLR